MYLLKIKFYSKVLNNFIRIPIFRKNILNFFSKANLFSVNFKYFKFIIRNVYIISMIINILLKILLFSSSVKNELNNFCFNYNVNCKNKNIFQNFDY